MDTFLVRTLLVPSTVVLLGRWNWWPSRMSRKDAQITGAGDQGGGGPDGPPQAPPGQGGRLSQVPATERG